MKIFFVLLIFIVSFFGKKVDAIDAYFEWTNTHILVDYGDSIEKYKNQYEIHFYVDGKENDNFKVKMGTNASTFSTVLTNRVGKYTVYYQAYSEEFNVRSEQAIVFEVVDRVPPTVEVENTNIKLNFGEKFEYQKYMSVTDNSCKIDEIDICLINENGINYSMLGTYHVPIIISDLYDNSVRIDFQVTIVDGIAPTIRQIKSPVINYGESLEIDDFFVAIDNYDGNISSFLEVNKFDEKRLGYQEIELKVNDMSGNKTTAIFNVLIVDDTPPELLLKTYSLELDIKEYSMFTKDYFKQFLLNVDDNYQLSSIDIDISNIKGLVGTYDVIFKATDSSGNETKKIIKVNLVEVSGPTVMANAVVSFPVGTNIDYYSLVEIDGEFDYLAHQKIEIVTNTVDVNTPGKYYVTYRCANSSVEYTIYTVEVTIYEDDIENSRDIFYIIIIVVSFILLGAIIYFVKIKVSRRV